MRPGYLCVSGLHSKPAVVKSKAYLGAIGPVERARVMDLAAAGDDKAITPAARVPCLEPKCSYYAIGNFKSNCGVGHSSCLEAMQRGVEGCRKIIESIMEGLMFRNNKFTVIDLCCNRRFRVLCLSGAIYFVNCVCYLIHGSSCVARCACLTSLVWPVG